MEKIFCSHISQLSEVAAQLIDKCQHEPVWVFKGRMGAGKTTLIKEVAKLFGVVDNVSSPTFSIVNEYQDAKGTSYYHFDFYRVEDAAEALDIGVEEYFYSGNYCWIEWAEKIAEYVPRDFVLIDISADESEERVITINIIKDGR